MQRGCHEYAPKVDMHIPSPEMKQGLDQTRSQRATGMPCTVETDEGLSLMISPVELYTHIIDGPSVQISSAQLSSRKRL
jgi:hypothetical protein